MNYKLSVFADRVNGFDSYVIERSGDIVKADVTAFNGTNIKANALKTLETSLGVAKTLVKHDDWLIVELQNQTLIDWVTGHKDLKEYSDELNRVFKAIDMVNCRVRYTCATNSFAKEYAIENGITKKKYSTVDDLLSEEPEE